MATTITRIAERIARDRAPAPPVRFEVADLLARVDAALARRAA